MPPLMKEYVAEKKYSNWRKQVLRKKESVIMGEKHVMIDVC
jgi:hypothetical protein